MKFFRKNGEPAAEHEQRQVLVVESEGAPEELNEQAERDQPDGARRARIPATHRHLR